MGGLLLSLGCATKPTVNIPHTFLGDSPLKERYLALGQPYLIIQKPKVPKGTRLLHLASQAAGKKSTALQGLRELDTHLIAQNLALGLRIRGANIMAYRSGQMGGKDRFIKKLNPSGVLEMSLSIPTFSKEIHQEERSVKDKDGKRKKEVVNYLIFKCAIGGKIRLTGHPSNKLLHEKKFVLVAQDRFNPIKDVKEMPGESFFRRLTDKTLQNTARVLVPSLCPVRTTFRQRPLFVTKDDLESEKIFKKLRRKKWQEAETLIETRIKSGRGEWKDKWNLAVSAEGQHDYPKARKLYSATAPDAIQHEASFQNTIETILADLNSSLFAHHPMSREAKEWFHTPLAVLPFADEVVSLDGPDFVRDLIYSLLTQGGYNTIPVEKVMSTLKNHGFSEGGQLKATTPLNISKWLSAPRLLFGYIEEFNEVNVGIYKKRIVTGDVFIWDKNSAQKIWKNNGTIRTESLQVKSLGDMGISFLGGLAGSWWDRLRNKPLGPESQEFARLMLETLPLRP